MKGLKWTFVKDYAKFKEFFQQQALRDFHDHCLFLWFPFEKGQKTSSFQI